MSATKLQCDPVEEPELMYMCKGRDATQPKHRFMVVHKEATADGLGLIQLRPEFG